MIYEDKYQVSWQHNNNGHKTPGSTQCIINSVITNGDDTRTFQTAASGLARCSKTDHYNKRLGRKLSFERAVKQIPNKDDRKLLWENFIKSSPRCLTCH